VTSDDRRAREKTAVQDKILNAARELFIKEGYESVSLRKIAEAIEYTPPALYTHFADKADLLRALCRRDFGALSEASISSAIHLTDPIARIIAIGHTYIRFAVDHPHHYRFMFMTRHPAEVEPEAEDLAMKDKPECDGYAFLRQAAADAIALNLLRPEYTDHELCAQVLWAGVHGLASLEITMGDDPWINWTPLDARARAMSSALLRGMLLDPARLELSLAALATQEARP
jgi:AcrR family transcriptional regulator